MSTRLDIPNRRPQALFDFTWSAKASFTVALGWPDAGAMRRGDDPIEVFVSCDRTTDVEVLGHDVGILVSLLRQHGCSFETMRDAVTRLEDPTLPPASRPPPASLIGRVLDEIEAFTREEAMALAGGST